MKNYLFGKQAFYKLNNPEGNYFDTLEKHYSPAYLKSGFVVRYEGIDPSGRVEPDGKPKTKQSFILFNDHIDFLNYFYQVPLKYRNFFEVMLDKAQKPHFDIDIDFKDYENFTDKSNSFDDEFKYTLSFTINACKEVFAQYKLKLDVEKNVVICTSHGENKRSAHVTIHGFSHLNCVEAKAFYVLVKNNMPVRYQRWMDDSVYKPTQNWRLVGNQKSCTTRTKVLQHQWEFCDEGVWKTITFQPHSQYKVNKIIFEFELTLLQNFVSQMLPSFVDRAGEINHEIVRLNLNRENGNSHWNDEPGDDETLEKIKELIKQKLGMNVFPFRVLHNYKCMIVFKKKIPYTCPVCQIVHQNQNPYCKIDKGVAWLDCRRSSAHTPDHKPKSTYLGRIYDVQQEDEPEDENDEEDELFEKRKMFQKNKEKGDEGEKEEKGEKIVVQVEKSISYQQLEKDEEPEEPLTKLQNLDALEAFF